MNPVRRLTQGIAVAALASACLPAQAFVTFIDNFKAVSNGVTILDDTFGDGVLPPSAQNCLLAAAPNCYVTDPASFPAGSESGGKLRIDTATGSLSERAQLAHQGKSCAGAC